MGVYANIRTDLNIKVKVLKTQDNQRECHLISIQEFKGAAILASGNYTSSGITNSLHVSVLVYINL